LHRAVLILLLLTFALNCGGHKTSGTTRGDPSRLAGDIVGGDAVVAGDPSLAGDASIPDAVTPSTQFCASGGSVSGGNLRGFVCLGPLGSGGQISSNAQHRWIPGPAHVVEAP